MSNLPLSIGLIHFIGIGGIGMSGIAEVLNELGYKVSGSDIAENNNTKRLKDLGIEVFIGHEKTNVSDAQIIVVSTAISKDNSELIEAKSKKIPIVHRAEMLCELMRLKWSIAIAGTHGKTTTTSLVASLLDGADFDPTVINGGIINNWKSNAKIGKGEWMVVEADESDGSFSKLTPTVAVVTNIDSEHLDYHGSFENLENAFNKFVSSIPFYGFKVLCIDHPVVQKLIPLNKDRRLLTYGLSTTADVKAANIEYFDNYTSFDVVLSNKILTSAETWKKITLPMLGKHNVLNCLASISIAIEMGISENSIRNTLNNFKGIKRRFESKGVTNDGIKIIDDYGHHPVEITYALSSGRILASKNKLIAIFQPHRYSRLKDLFDEFCQCFNNADYVFITDVYAAGESEIKNFNKETLAAGISDFGHNNVSIINNENEICDKIHSIAKPNDVVIFLGAGSITKWSDTIVHQLNNSGLKNEKLF